MTPAVAVEEVFVHPSAVIDPPCRIGAGSRIWHFCHLMAGAEIGRDCVLGQGVFVGAGVRIGDGCKIQNHVSLYTGVELAEQVFVGPAACFTNVRTPRAFVGRNTEADRSPTRVGRGATIGANATVVCGVTVGRWALVGAGSVVTADVADHALVVGNPARPVGWACRCGARLAPHPGGLACPECQRRFRLTAAGIQDVSSE